MASETDESVMTQQKPDQRKHPRKPCFIAVDCSTWGDSLKGFVKDISLGGAFIMSIETDRVLSVGQLITVNFAALPDRQEPIELPAEVVWTVPDGIGVKFTAPDKDLETIMESL